MNIGRQRKKGEVITWTCHICGEERPDEHIGVWKTDIGEQQGLPPGTLMQNVRYCLDRPSCCENAPSVSFLEKQTDSK